MSLSLVSIARISNNLTPRKALWIILCFVFGLFFLERSLEASENPPLHAPLELFELAEDDVTNGQSHGKSSTGDSQNQENNKLRNAVHLERDSATV